MKGKNFSANNLGQRKKSDFYETPYSLTWQLLENEDFSDCKSILEPACGNKAISKQLEKTFFVTSRDIVQTGHDFLLETEVHDCIITNPPFSLALEFIKKAKEIAKHKFAFLLPLSYLHGEQRYKEVYQDKVYPLRCIYVFTRYPMLGDILREDGKYRTGMMVYAWYVWQKNLSYTLDPEIRWISNQKYILNKSDKENNTNIERS
jgi:hypothetical protein